MMKLRGGATTEADDNEIFRDIFLQKVPTYIRTVLTLYKTEKLGNQADIADSIAEKQAPQHPAQDFAVQRKENSEMGKIHAELKRIWQELQFQQQGNYSKMFQTIASKSDICGYVRQIRPCKFE